MFYIILAFMLVVLTLTWIPWRDIFEKLWGNNPRRAKVYVEAGEQVTICRGSLRGDCPKGFVYRFKYFGVWNSIIVPVKYPYRYILGCRQIRVIIGMPVAQPLGGMMLNELRVSSTALDAIFKAHIGSDLARTIFGKAFNWMMLLIVGVVLILGGYMVARQFIEVPGVSPGIEQPAPAKPAQPSGPIGMVIDYGG